MKNCKAIKRFRQRIKREVEALELWLMNIRLAAFVEPEYVEPIFQQDIPRPASMTVIRPAPAGPNWEFAVFNAFSF